MRSKFTVIMTLFLALFVQFSFAQEKTITGVVSSSEDGLPLIGASVMVQGTTRGTQTDLDGNYSIKASQGEKLVFTYVGMQEQVLLVTATNTINVVLQPSTVIGTVVIEGGYRTLSKPKSAQAVTSVTAKEMENRPNPNFLTTLQGQAAGANITAFSGQPGTNKMDVVIRGQGTVNASTEPLYVIDGVPLNQAFVRNLNANEIASVTVLKDAAATSIYGNRGSNGVIVITTKKGGFNESFDVSYSTSYGLTKFRGDDYNLSNTQEILRFQQIADAAGVPNMGSSLGVSGDAPGFGGLITLDPNNLQDYRVDTRWRDFFFRSGTTVSHDLGISAGGKNASNYTSIGYFDQDGIVPTTGFKRITIRNNFSGKSKNDKFSYGFNIFGAFSTRRQLEQETRSSGEFSINTNVLQNPLTGYLNSMPYVSPTLYQSGQQLYDELGSPSLALTPLMLIDLFQGNNAYNKFKELKTIVTSNADYKITEDLSIGATMGIDFATDNRIFAIGPEAYLSVIRAASAQQDYHGFETNNYTNEFAYNHVNRIRYSKVFNDKHSLDLGLYSEYITANRWASQSTHVGLNPLNWAPGAGTGYIQYDPNTMPISYRPSASASKRRAEMLSFFGTADYDYDSKYGVSATIRRDGSYRFVGDNRWATFWALAARWNISEEDFLRESEVITDMKLRGSYGTTGNQNVVSRGVDSNSSAIFLGANLVRSLNASTTGYNNLPAFYVSSYENPDLKWETTTQWNVGLDFSIKNRLHTQVDFYNRQTDDLYVSIPISSANGISLLNANSGSLQNRGVELNLRYDIFRDTEFKLTVFANGAYNRSKWLDLGLLDPDGDGRNTQNSGLITYKGGLLNEYYAVPYVGVNPQNGELQFLGIDGNITEQPTEEDRRPLGKSALPLYQGGFGFNASYKGFFVDALFVYAAEAYKYDTDYISLMDPRNANLFPVSTDLFNAWTSSNTNTDVPSLTASNIDRQNISDRFLRDASYIRLRNLSVGYSVPERFLEKTFIKTLRFRVQAENYLTFTKWKGFDPESYVTTQTGYYPTPKIMTFGVDINF